MSPGTLAPITYVLHYLLARLVYDELVRPVIRGDVAVPALICAVALAAFMAGRWAGRHRT